MCGICGKINFDSNFADQGLILRMLKVLEHRGPDGEGVIIRGKAALGHRRLKIIDLSEAGRQPMSNEDGSIWIVYNGEIYNFRELREELQKKGHIFRSGTDTEVIIHLYEEKGLDCLDSLRGMFAFAIWDENKERLFLARDRLGQKPLNYIVNGRNLIFASEIKSILEDHSISREVNFEALDLYLTYQCIPAPETIFSGIKKLPPAHRLILESGEIRIERYWDLSYQNSLKMEEGEYAGRLLDIFRQACKIRMVSDVPLGAFLSGGLDSSAVVAMMSRESLRPVKTFSIGFKERSFNELQYARRIAELFGTEHREYIVEIDVLDLLSKLVWHFNEPFADSSNVPTYYLSRMTRREVTVALNGDGGDESFAGYQRYAAVKMSELYRLIPSFLRSGFSAFIRNFPEGTKKKDFIRRLKRFVLPGSLPIEDRYVYWVSTFGQDLKSRLYSREFKNNLRQANSNDYIYDAYKKSDAGDFINVILSVDVRTYLPNDLLVKVDIASMANSLEARSPFLDHELVEFAAKIPAKLKLKGLTGKYILKKALRGILPKDILHRQKSGFGVPVGSWFKDKLKAYTRDLLLSQKSLKRGYFEEGALRRILEEHNTGRIDHGHRIWSLVNLELWHQIFID